MRRGVSQGSILGPLQFFLTISLPGESKIKIQDESQISFCKILKNK